MVFDDLLTARFQQYFDQLLSRSPLWLFVHVPKTAGSSLNAELAPILTPNHHIFIDYEKLDRHTFEELLSAAVERFISLATKRRFAYCTGHLTAGHVARITGALRDVQPITLLRDPVARVVSDFRYQSSHMHPGNEQFRRTHPVIESYLDVPGEWNKAAAHLVPQVLRDTGDTQACIDHIQSSYAFVGIQETYALSLRLLTTLAGAPRRPGAFRRVNTATAETAIHLSPQAERRIRDNNALDIAIYDAFASRLQTITPALIDYLDRVDPMPETVQ